MISQVQAKVRMILTYDLTMRAIMVFRKAPLIVIPPSSNGILLKLEMELLSASIPKRHNVRIYKDTQNVATWHQKE